MAEHAVPVTAPLRSPVGRRPAGRSGPRLTLARLALRSCRTSAVVVVGTTVLLIGFGLAAVTESAAIQSIDMGSLVDNPAIRALYGQAYDLTTAGGFVAWRYGQVLCVVVSVWGMLTATRLLRGDEEVGRTDLVLAGPTTRREVVGATVGVLGAVAAILTIGLVIAFLLAGQAVVGSALFALGYGLALATFVGLGAVVAQVFAPRRRAAGVGGAIIAATYLLRMVADASGSVAWMRWFTPFGWVELLRPFAVDTAAALIPLVVAPAVLAGVAVFLSGRRDLGEGLVRDATTADLRPAGLAGAPGFALRQRTGGIVGWGIGVAVFGLVIGGITSAFVDFATTSPSFVELANAFGMAWLSTPQGFIGTMDTIGALVLVGYAISSVRTLWEDEGAGRLELVFVAPVTRTRWALAAIVATAGALVLLGAVLAVTTWVGVVVGGASVPLGDSLAGIANLIPVVVLFGGIVFALHGTVPSVATPVTSVLLVGSYLLGLLGPALKWPDRVLDLSPFRHLAVVPAQPVAWTPALVMTTIGVLGLVVGLVGYARRDLS